MRGMQARMEGRVIRQVLVRRPDLRWPLPEGLSERLAGRAVLGFRRRAKYILMRLGGGDSLLLHLGMSGRIVIAPRGANAHTPHEHMVLETDDGWSVGFVDPRRFGSIDLVASGAEDAHRLLAGLGPEPLDPAFNGASLLASLAGKRTRIKAALLDQRLVAGLGNIYVCEALFRARVAPDRPAASVSAGEADLLAREVKATLLEAIAAGGSSLRDYVQPSGELGYFQNAWKVYGREGQPCERCPGVPACPGIVRVAQGGRSTFLCSRTQA